ncbi:MAG: hypothetical protein ACK4YP_09330 [Myxococcota bacterium]
MDPLAPKPPGKIQAIGVMHLVGGIFNIIMSLTWAFLGLSTAVFTFGIGLLYCCPVILLLPIGIMEIISGAKHLSSDHAGLTPPKTTAILEIAGILACSTFSLIFGILTLVFLNDPEVSEYYASKRLTG